MIIKRARNADVTVAPDGVIGSDGAGDVIRGWRGICSEARRSRVQLWRDIRAGRFPPPIELGPNSIGWFRAEIEAWKASRPRRRYRGTSEADRTMTGIVNPDSDGAVDFLSAIEPGGPIATRTFRDRVEISHQASAAGRNGKRAITSRKDLPGLRPQLARDGPDYWPTIDTGIRQLLVKDVLPACPSASVWEAAAGAGHLLDVMLAAGRSVIASDLFPARADIFSHDFLRDEPPPASVGAVVITNPPYSALDDFIRQGLALIDRNWLVGMALLLRNDQDTAKCRAYALNRAAEEWLCCGWRPQWIANTDTNGRFTNFWVLWRADHPGPPVRNHVTEDDLHQPSLEWGRPAASLAQ